jgi:uncharacterized protein (DUF433 family)
LKRINNFFGFCQAENSALRVLRFSCRTGKRGTSKENGLPVDWRTTSSGGSLRRWAEGGNRVTMLNMNYQNIITIEPGKRGGKPCIRGMRITVYDVPEYLASGMTQEEILGDFPYLNESDVRACLAYAADREKRLMVIEG